jgi:hypothetical protein
MCGSTFDLFGAVPRDVWSEESAHDERAPRGADPVGDATCRGSSGGGRSGGQQALTRTTLDTKQSAEDRTTAAQSAAAKAVTEQDALALRLALAEAEVEKLRAAATSAEEAAKRARTVTEPLKIILYYCLSLSTWPLSNNKELFCRFCRVKPGKSLTTGSRYALSPHEGGTRVHHFIT